jgi:hypothetical protein
VYPGIYPSVQRECSSYDSPISVLSYSLNASIQQQAAAHALSTQADYVLVFTYELGSYPGQVALVNSIPPEKAIVVSLQNPYDIERGIQPAAYVAAFNASVGSITAVCAVLYGKQPAIGKWIPQTQPPE